MATRSSVSLHNCARARNASIHTQGRRRPTPPPVGRQRGVPCDVGSGTGSKVPWSEAYARDAVGLGHGLGVMSNLGRLREVTLGPRRRPSGHGRLRGCVMCYGIRAGVQGALERGVRTTSYLHTWARSCTNQSCTHPCGCRLYRGNCASPGLHWIEPWWDHRSATSVGTRSDLNDEL